MYQHLFHTRNHIKQQGLFGLWFCLGMYANQQSHFVFLQGNAGYHGVSKIGRGWFSGRCHERIRKGHTWIVLTKSEWPKTAMLELRSAWCWEVWPLQTKWASCSSSASWWIPLWCEPCWCLQCSHWIRAWIIGPPICQRPRSLGWNEKKSCAPGSCCFRLMAKAC